MSLRLAAIVGNPALDRLVLVFTVQSRSKMIETLLLQRVLSLWARFKTFDCVLLRPLTMFKILFLFCLFVFCVCCH